MRWVCQVEDKVFIHHFMVTIKELTRKVVDKTILNKYFYCILISGSDTARKRTSDVTAEGGRNNHVKEYKQTGVVDQ